MPDLTERTIRRLCHESGLRHSDGQLAIELSVAPFAAVRIEDAGMSEAVRLRAGANARGWGCGIYCTSRRELFVLLAPAGTMVRDVGSWAALVPAWSEWTEALASWVCDRLPGHPDRVAARW